MPRQSHDSPDWENELDEKKLKHTQTVSKTVGKPEKEFEHHQTDNKNKNIKHYLATSNII